MNGPSECIKLFTPNARIPVMCAVKSIGFGDYSIYKFKPETDAEEGYLVTKSGALHPEIIASVDKADMNISDEDLELIDLYLRTRSKQDPSFHWWCGAGFVASRLLFAFGCVNIAQLGSLLELVQDQVESCLNCARCFFFYRDDFLKKLKPSREALSDEAFEDLTLFFRTADVERMERMAQLPGNSSKLLYQVLARLELWLDPVLFPRLTSLLWSHIENELKTFSSESAAPKWSLYQKSLCYDVEEHELLQNTPLPAIFLLCTHPISHIKTWAMTLLKICGKEIQSNHTVFTLSFAPVLNASGEIIVRHMFVEDDERSSFQKIGFWSGLLFLLQLLPVRFPALVFENIGSTIDILIQEIADSSKNDPFRVYLLPQMFKCFGRLLPLFNDGDSDYWNQLAFQPRMILNEIDSLVESPGLKSSALIQIIEVLPQFLMASRGLSDDEFQGHVNQILHILLRLTEKTNDSASVFKAFTAFFRIIDVGMKEKLVPFLYDCLETWIHVVGDFMLKGQLYSTVFAISKEKVEELHSKAIAIVSLILVGDTLNMLRICRVCGQMNVKMLEDDFDPLSFTSQHGVTSFWCSALWQFLVNVQDLSRIPMDIHRALFLIYSYVGLHSGEIFGSNSKLADPSRLKVYAQAFQDYQDVFMQYFSRLCDSTDEFLSLLSTEIAIARYCFSWVIVPRTQFKSKLAVLLRKIVPKPLIPDCLLELFRLQPVEFVAGVQSCIEFVVEYRSFEYAGDLIVNIFYWLELLAKEQAFLSGLSQSVCKKLSLFSILSINKQVPLFEILQEADRKQILRVGTIALRHLNASKTPAFESQSTYSKCLDVCLQSFQTMDLEEGHLQYLVAFLGSFPSTISQSDEVADVIDAYSSLIKKIRHDLRTNNLLDSSLGWFSAGYDLDSLEEQVRRSLEETDSALQKVQRMKKSDARHAQNLKHRNRVMDAQRRASQQHLFSNIVGNSSENPSELQNLFSKSTTKSKSIVITPPVDSLENIPKKKSFAGALVPDNVQSILYLHEFVLNWSPNKVSTQIATELKPKLISPPSTFDSAQKYQESFYPLLLEECRACIEGELEQMLVMSEFPAAIQCLGETVNDSYVHLEFSTSSLHPINRKSKFDKETGNEDWSAMDLVILARSKDVMKARESTFQYVLENCRTLFGLVQESNMSLQGRKFQIRCSAKETSKVGQVGNLSTSEWILFRVTNLITIQRELEALRQVSHLKLLKQVLCSSDMPRLDLDDLDDESEVSKFRLNESQKEAVMKAVCREPTGFSLIQGPPGTGKTQTIVSIVSTLLSTTHEDVKLDTDGKVSGWRARDAKQKRSSARQHILVCAPSNAAVDELTQRLADLQPSDWDERFPNLKFIIRYGSGITDRDLASKYSIESILDKEMSQRDSEKASNKGVETIEEEITKVQSKIAELTKTKGSEVEILKLQQKKTDLMTERREMNSKSKNQRTKRSEILKSRRLELLGGAKIVCCTLSTSGADIFKQLDHGFETVIIDECTQAVELSTLIPLQYQARRCVLVGDPQQLPATVISRNASDYSYQRSLFERIQDNSRDFTMLRTQYRMHPEIRHFPSNFFYDGKLQDGFPAMSSHWKKSFYSDEIMKPFTFFDMDSVESESGRSFKNLKEASLCIYIFEHILDVCHSESSISVGFVTPYQEQVREIRSMLRSVSYPKSVSVAVSSVDGFQGQEKDFIIFSCVRAKKSYASKASRSSIGFVSDIRRMNVAITRARYCLFVIGCSTVLRMNDAWKSFVDDADARGKIKHLNSPEHLFRQDRSGSSNSQTLSSKRQNADNDSSKSDIAPLKRKKMTSLNERRDSREQDLGTSRGIKRPVFDERIPKKPLESDSRSGSSPAEITTPLTSQRPRSQQDKVLRRAPEIQKQQRKTVIQINQFEDRLGYSAAPKGTNPNQPQNQQQSVRQILPPPPPPLQGYRQPPQQPRQMERPYYQNTAVPHYVPEMYGSHHPLPYGASVYNYPPPAPPQHQYPPNARYQQPPYQQRQPPYPGRGPLRGGGYHDYRDFYERR